MNSGAEWSVLLIGGPSGIGKTTVAAQLARRLDVSWLMVDDLRLALARSGVPIPDSGAVMTFDAPGGLVTVGGLLTPAVEVVIENHVDQRYPVVIEGDGILPSLFDRPSVRARATHGRIRAVFLHEPDADALHANFVARSRDGWRADLQAHARKNFLFGQWVKQDAEQRGLSCVAARPWDTLVERILTASELL